MDLLCTVPYYAAALCLALRRAGIDTAFGLTTYYKDPAHFRASQLRTDPGLLDLAGRFPSLPPALRRIAKTLEALVNLAALAVRFAVRPPGIVHVQFLALFLHGWPFELWLLAWARRRGAKLVYTVHDSLPHDSGQQYRDKYARLYARFDALICHSEDARGKLARDFRIDPARISVIPHGPLFDTLPDMPRDAALALLGLSPPAGLVLCQGILRPYKGIPFLLDAWQQVALRRPAALLAIAGSGAPELEAELRRQTHDLGLSASVRLDFRYLPEQDLAAYYSAADIVVYPYREITTSGALMTGITRNRPIVATALPVFQEILEDGRSARLVPYGDTAALAAALLALLDDPAECRRLAAAASAVQREFFSWDSIANRTAALYRHLRT